MNGKTNTNHELYEGRHVCLFMYEQKELFSTGRSCVCAVTVPILSPFLLSTEAKSVCVLSKLTIDFGKPMSNQSNDVTPNQPKKTTARSKYHLGVRVCGNTVFAEMVEKLD